MSHGESAKAQHPSIAAWGLVLLGHGLTRLPERGWATTCPLFGVRPKPVITGLRPVFKSVVVGTFLASG
ncbi:uncharacterized protein G2W53_001569 [Senna tora]|uniref:Uncharacterized protein n=1 Tax=Senna tora TaxID=362788 RepID=A0A835CJK1_9FABA|nr:uncharacterized protein G2W53_001569 [Senna tora]